MDGLLLDHDDVNMENIDEHVDDEITAQVEEIGEDEYDAMLDDCYESVTIGGIQFYPSDILKNCDPTGYRVGFADYQDSRREDFEDDVRDELESLIEARQDNCAC